MHALSDTDGSMQNHGIEHAPSYRSTGYEDAAEKSQQGYQT